MTWPWLKGKMATGKLGLGRAGRCGGERWIPVLEDVSEVVATGGFIVLAVQQVCLSGCSSWVFDRGWRGRRLKDGWLADGFEV